MPARRPPITIADRDQAIASLFLYGESARSLAGTFGVSLETVYKILRHNLPVEKLAELGWKRGPSSARRDPSEKRARVYRYLLDYKAAHQGATPSIRQIAGACGISSKSVVFYHLGMLSEQGLIETERPNNRSLIITIPGARWLPPEGGG